MASTSYTDGVTVVTADTMNDLNRLHYTILSDPADAAAVASPLSTISTVASATSPNIFAVTVGQVVDYTGTATATSFATAPQAGARRTLVCAGASVFTAGANMLIDGIASASNFTAAAGDKVHVIAVTTTQFRLTPAKYDGTAVAASSPFSQSFTSTAQTITAGGTLTLAHGLSSQPVLWFAELSCTTAELGYSIGDETTAQMTASDTAADYGQSIVPDATNLNIRFGAVAGVFLVNRKDTGANSNITPANWTIKYRAWA